MSTLITPQENTGGIPAYGIAGNMVHTTSSGSIISLTLNVNVITVFESLDRGATWTQRAQLALEFEGATYNFVTSAIAADNSVSIVWVNSSGGTSNIYHKKMSASWTFGSSELVFTANGNYSLVQGIPVNVEVSDTGVPYVVLQFRDNSSGNAYVRTAMRASSGTWYQSGDTVSFAPGSGYYASSGSVAILPMGNSGTTRHVVYAFEVAGSDGSSWVHSGTRIYTIPWNESGTAPTAGATDRYASTGEPNAAGFYRKLRLFRNPQRLGQFILAAIGNQGGGSKNQLIAMKIGYDGTTFSRSSSGGVGNGAAAFVNWPANENIFTPYSTVIIGKNANLVFLLSANDGTNQRAGNVTVMWKGQFESEYDVANSRFWDNAISDGGMSGITGGGWRNADKDYYDAVIMLAKQYRHQAAQTPRTLTSFTPANGATGQSATPDLTGVVTGPVTWSQADVVLNYQFSLDPSFGSGVRDYLQPTLGPSFGDSTKTQRNYLDLHGSDTNPKNYADRLPSSLALPGGLWYLRARLVDSLGRVGAWSTDGRRIAVGHPPTANAVSPINNQYFEYGSGDKTFTWSFSDTSTTDSQTAYQVRIKRDSDSTIVFDSGKVSSSASTLTVNIPAGYKNTTLYWEVRLWDTNDAVGEYSANSSFFQMVDPATVVVTAPTAGQVLTTGIPTLTGKVTTQGARKVIEWVFVITQGGSDVWTSRRFFGAIGNNETMSTTVPSNLLQNNKNYTLQIKIVDDAQITNASPPSSFSTAWTSPSGPNAVAADISLYNVDTSGYVTVSWTDANREAEFSAWILYRRADILNPFDASVLRTGDLEEVGRVYSINGAGYMYRDYLAPAGQKVTYIVHQQVNRAGFVLESENTTGAACYPVTDAYWMIDMLDDTPTSLKLPIVTADSFTEEQEEAEYNVIGRGRHVDKGEVLGPKGSLDVQIRMGRVTSPRLQRIRMLEIQERNTDVYLRNPFGDVMKVNVSAMSVSRISGVGALEYCDITLPYAKVG